MGEYFAGRGYQGGGTNQLIFNYKCLPSKAAAHAGRKGYKDRAVAEIAAGLRTVISAEDLTKITWVPIPPSKAVGHAEYDDRLVLTLESAFAGQNPDIRRALFQAESTEADHTTGARITPDELFEVMRLNLAQLQVAPLRQTRVLFDDVLTTGKHFRVAERRLRKYVPAATPIVGLFVARRVLNVAKADDFDIVP